MSTHLPQPPTEPLVDDRPWGSFRQYTHNEPTTVKLIVVKPGAALSLQRHAHRDELWVALDDGLVATVGDDEHALDTGDEVFIRRGQLHRLASRGAAAGRILEIAFGEFDEADIERVDDIYGRS